ncbi:dihydrofolate reductase [Nocardioidaceae bacterium]|nr:dihydrofolate reductase [Nocardioidaceae bacterium]
MTAPSEPLTLVVPSDRAADRLAEHGGDLAAWQVVVWDGEGETPSGAAQAQVLLGAYMGDPWPADSMQRLPDLQAVQLLSAGFAGWDDALPEGVALCNGRGVHSASTAELAVLGVLGWRRELLRFLEQQAMERWEDQPRTGDLDGLPVLVLGAGDIAGYVKAGLEVFGAEVTMVGRTQRDGVVTVEEVDALLPTTMAVVVAWPLNEQTEMFLDGRRLDLLPDGAAVVNVARGAHVDTEALLGHLESERLHAFLDVTDPEPLPEGHPLWDAPNLTLTPHVGGGTQGWERRGFGLLGDQLRAYASGGVDALTNRVR